MRRPSDLGYDDGKFLLPELRTREIVTDTSYRRPGMLFALPAMSLKEQRDERKGSVRERCETVAQLVDDTYPAVCWCHLNDEGKTLTDLIPGAVEVKGGDSDERKEEAFEAFTSGQTRVLVTKPTIAGFGLNWQHCAHQTFFPSHSFEQYYQSVRRSWRFGQTRTVQVDIVTTEWACEIDRSASSVFCAHFDCPVYPDVRDLSNHGATYNGGITRQPVPRPDIICAGFPCQDLSVAGRRAGLAGKRSGLYWELTRVVDELRPRWVLYENVPGLLSSNGGRDMGAVLGALGNLGYGWAYRVLDAQYFGLAQRRKRVFIVGCLGDVRRAGQVLFEPESVCGNSAPCREAGDDAAGTIGSCVGGRRTTDLDGHGAYVGSVGTLRKGNGGITGGVPFVAGCLQERDAKGADSDTKPGHLIVNTILASAGSPRDTGCSATRLPCQS